MSYAYSTEKGGEKVPKNKPVTNITKAHKDSFFALNSGKYVNFALFSCFVNGEPASAIVAVNKRGEDYDIQPLYVSITPGMKIVDHDGQAPNM
jgi:hypothetical protein